MRVRRQAAATSGPIRPERDASVLPTEPARTGCRVGRRASRSTIADISGRAAKDELRGEDDLAGSAAGLADSAAARAAPSRVPSPRSAGARSRAWAGISQRGGQVVEADDGDVVRHPASGILDRLHGRDGHAVGRDEHARPGPDAGRAACSWPPPRSSPGRLRPPPVTGRPGAQRPRAHRGSPPADRSPRGGPACRGWSRWSVGRSR